MLPDKAPYWQQLESVCQAVTRAYGYREIRFPLLESSALFKRSIGEVTDIVEKEMYTFADRNGDSLTLRPEGTAGCVRAAIEHGLLYNQLQRLWYLGPMFRHERPQKGRYRQFCQLGVEAYGMTGPDIDAEIILLAARLLNELGLMNNIVLQINTLGTPAVRKAYRQSLIDYFSQRKGELDEDSQRRLHTNPLRILDSKNPAMQNLIAEAPVMTNCLDAMSRQHFDGLCDYLSAAGQSFECNPNLVRGLDYYGLTVFEWVSTDLGAQATVCGGGRYDGMVELLGGKATPAVGFSAGLDRLVLLMEASQTLAQSLDVFMVLSEQALANGLVLAEQLRNALPDLTLETHLGGSSFKSQFKRAFKSGAKWALILGDDELSQSTVTLKNLQQEEEQASIACDQLIEWFKQEKSNG